MIRATAPKAPIFFRPRLASPRHLEVLDGSTVALLRVFSSTCLEVPIRLFHRIFTTKSVSSSRSGPFRGTKSQMRRSRSYKPYYGLLGSGFQIQIIRLSLNVISLDVIRYEIVGVIMARGGINKAVVQKARHALLARGLNPTIDRIRAEMGNTGSNTTISRYLRELETSEPSAVPARKRLGDQLTSMLESLLDQLLEEGAQIAADAKAEFEIERATSQSLISDLRSELLSSQREVATQQSALEIQAAELQTLQSSLQAEMTRNAGLGQRCGDLEVLIVEKDRQIQSLEEKHVHARGALEHYRESVKEQRDQDQRRHEAQLQESQVEQRKLRESLAVKQDESTRLNRENERLLAESRQQTKALHTQSDQIQTLTAQTQALALAEARAGAIIEHHLSQVTELSGEIKSLNLSAAQATVREAELAKLVAELKARLEQSVITQPKVDEQPSIEQTGQEPQGTPAPTASHSKRKRK
ncbi:Cointegrate resolution protein T [Pseudomonas amygdali pv. myricae]|nr:Cointegrate resolution protein T [Pseudomonas amygdali pv. myricae]